MRILTCIYVDLIINKLAFNIFYFVMCLFILVFRVQCMSEDIISGRGETGASERNISGCASTKDPLSIESKRNRKRAFKESICF